MNEDNFQIKSLEAIIRAASFAPIFKRNPRHCIDQFADFTPYISYNDIVNKRLFIRGCPIGSKNCTDTGKREIIVKYATVGDLVNDGWQLDSQIKL
jgi:hypothetical protein